METEMNRAETSDPELDAFNVLVKASRGQLSSTSDEAKPACLHSRPFPTPCCICGKFLTNLNQALNHVQEHLAQEDEATPTGRTCCFCGMLFISVIALSMHQICEPMIKRCDTCLTSLPTDDDEANHMCQQADATESNIQCPLCPLKVMKENFHSHMKLFHGCDETDFQLDLQGQQAVMTTSKDLQTCINCAAKINTERVTMIQHLSTQCLKLHKVTKALNRTYKSLSKKSGISADVFYRLELEAFHEAWTSGTEADESKIPSSFKGANRQALSSFSDPNSDDQNLVFEVAEGVNEIRAQSCQNESANIVRLHASVRRKLEENDEEQDDEGDWPEAANAKTEDDHDHPAAHVLERVQEELFRDNVQ